LDRHFEPWINGLNGSATNKDDVRKTKAQKAAAKAAAKERAAQKGGRTKGKPKIKGSGAYVADFSETAGKKLGRMVGSQVERILGVGDYRAVPGGPQADVVTNEIAAGVPMSAEVGRVHTVRVRHTECLGWVQTSSTAGAFSVFNLPVQPGIKNAFPWLSSMAPCFEKWRLNKCLYKLESDVTPFSTAGAMGFVLCNHIVDPNRPAATSLFEMKGQDGVVCGRLDQNVICGVECKGNPWLLVRTNSATNPLVATDCGYIQVALAPSAAFTTSCNTHLLSVTYEIEFADPVLPTAAYGYLHAYRTGVATATPFGATSGALNTYGALAGSTVTGNVITMPYLVLSQYIHVIVSWQGAGVTYSLPTITYTGLTQVSVYNGQTSQYIAAPATGTTGATSCVWSAIYQVTAGEGTIPTITFATTGSVVPTGTCCDVNVYSMGMSLTSATA